MQLNMLVCSLFALQALVETPAVSAAQLEALAELCLAPGRPWRCPAIAAGLLGFTLRRALAGSRSQPDVDVAARVGLGGTCSSFPGHAGVRHAWRRDNTCAV